MKKPAERDCVAVVPGYTGQVAKLYLGRDEEGRLAGVTIFDLLGHVKLQGTAEEAAAWSGEWLSQESDNRKARRTQLLAQLFLCKLTGDERPRSWPRSRRWGGRWPMPGCAAVAWPPRRGRRARRSGRKSGIGSTRLL